MDMEKFIESSAKLCADTLMKDNEIISVDDIAWESLSSVEDIRLKIKDLTENILIDKGITILK